VDSRTVQRLTMAADTKSLTLQGIEHW